MKKGNFTIIFVVLLISFFALCSFSVDTPLFVSTRFKLQRALEYTSQIAVLNAESPNINEIANEAFTYFRNSDPILRNAELVGVEVSSDLKKIKLDATVICPTYFLGMVGLNRVTLMARAYAKKEEVNYHSDIEELDLNNIITDKEGDDFKIQFNAPSGNYMIFGGIQNGGDYVWQNLSCKGVGVEIKSFDEEDKNMDYLEINEGDTINFDLGQDCDRGHNAGTVQKIRVINSLGVEPSYDFTILNNVKLVTREEYSL